MQKWGEKDKKQRRGEGVNIIGDHNYPAQSTKEMGITPKEIISEKKKTCCEDEKKPGRSWHNISGGEPTPKRPESKPFCSNQTLKEKLGFGVRRDPCSEWEAKKRG